VLDSNVDIRHLAYLTPRWRVVSGYNVTLKCAAYFLLHDTQPTHDGGLLSYTYVSMAGKRGGLLYAVIREQYYIWRDRYQLVSKNLLTMTEKKKLRISVTTTEMEITWRLIGVLSTRYTLQKSSGF